MLIHNASEFWRTTGGDGGAGLIPERGNRHPQVRPSRAIIFRQNVRQTRAAATTGCGTDSGDVAFLYPSLLAGLCDMDPGVSPFNLMAAIGRLIGRSGAARSMAVFRPRICAPGWDNVNFQRFIASPFHVVRSCLAVSIQPCSERWIFLPSAAIAGLMTLCSLLGSGGT